MSGRPITTVDVQDMLCAQALAVVARAVERLAAGSALDILYNADDVKQDLAVWATGRGYPLTDAGARLLRLEKRPAR